jgi:hypothetical protein
LSVLVERSFDSDLAQLAALQEVRVIRVTLQNAADESETALVQAADRLLDLGFSLRELLEVFSFDRERPEAAARPDFALRSRTLAGVLEQREFGALDVYSGGAADDFSREVLRELLLQHYPGLGEGAEAQQWIAGGMEMVAQAEQVDERSRTLPDSLL